MKNKSTFKLIIKIIGRVLLVLSVFFVAIKIKKLGIDLSSAGNIPGLLGVSAISLLLNIAATFILAFVWGGWISYLSGTKIQKSSILSIYGKSVIGKYLPGNVMHYVERNIFAADYGLSQKKIAFSSIMEMGTQALSAIVISVFLLPSALWNKVYMTIKDRVFIIVIIGCIGLAALAVFSVIILKKIRTSKMLEEYSIRGVSKTFIKSLLLCILYLLMNALGMLFISLYCTDNILSAYNIRLILSSYSIAWVCGFLIPGAPGGIGVREAILSVLLDAALGSSLMFILIFHRLITIIGDFSVYLIVRFIMPIFIKETVNAE